MKFTVCCHKMLSALVAATVAETLLTSNRSTETIAYVLCCPLITATTQDFSPNFSRLWAQALS